MKADQIRVSIAEACGWTKIGKYDGLPGLYGHRPDRPFGCLSKVPNYQNSFDAIHEAVMSREMSEQWMIFAMLTHVVPTDRPAAFGTAAQWSEAFLRALELWEDSK